MHMLVEKHEGASPMVTQTCYDAVENQEPRIIANCVNPLLTQLNKDLQNANSVGEQDRLVCFFIRDVKGCYTVLTSYCNSNDMNEINAALDKVYKDEYKQNTGRNLDCTPYTGSGASIGAHKSVALAIMASIIMIFFKLL
jgi:hypothetical protein